MRNSLKNTTQVVLLAVVLCFQNLSAQTPKNQQLQKPITENAYLISSNSKTPEQNLSTRPHKEFSFSGKKARKEDKDKRNLYSKHFQNDDGTSTAFIGLAPLHYEKNGHYYDIDLSIQQSSDFKYPFVNSSNLFESSFGSTAHKGVKNKTKEGEVMEFLNTKMYWEVNGQAISSSKSKDSELTIKGEKAYYHHLYEGVSAEFIMLTGKRKLNYIITEKNTLGNIPTGADYLVFSEDVILPFGWTSTQSDAGIIIRDSKGKEIYLYENPVSTDASNDLTYETNTVFEFLQLGNTLTLQTKVKTEWLLHSSRVFPVKVDPTVSVYPNGTIYRTGYAHPSGGEYGNIQVGFSGSHSFLGFATFDTSSIPDNSTINSTILNHHVRESTNMGTERGIEFGQFLELLPENFSAKYLALLLSSETYQTVYDVGTTGRKTVPLLPQASLDLENRLILDNFTIKYMPVGNYSGNQNVEIYGTPSIGENDPYLEVNYTENSFTLTVTDAYLGASHADGIHNLPDNALVTATSGARDGYTLLGWIGTGSVPASGIDEILSFTITENSTLTWIWEEIKCTASTTWDGFTWSNGIPNNPQTSIIFEGDFTADLFNTLSEGDLIGCSVEVRSGNVVISSGHNVTIDNEITVTAGASFTLQNNANLIQIHYEDVINSGNIRVERTFNFSPERNQYNFVNSPVIGQNITMIYDGSPKAQYYRESTNSFVYFNGDYLAGRAQALSEPSLIDEPNPETTAVFEGVPFNGTYTLTDLTNSYTGFHLIGNPYPSLLDLDVLYTDNPDLEPRFLFWDNRGNEQITQYGDGYQGQHYAQYNAVSQTGIPAAGVDTMDYTQRIPDRKVSVGGSFMARLIESIPTGEVSFENTQRITGESIAFFGKNAEVEKDRYWLTYTNPNQMNFTNAVVYFENGNDQYALEDSKTSGSSDEMYSIVDNHKLAIQGKAKFRENDTISIGYKAFESGQYKINLYKSEGIFTNGMNIYLQDFEKDSIQNLSQNGTYYFETQSGVFNERFIVFYQPDESEEPENPEEPEEPLSTMNYENENLMVYKQGNHTVIQSASSNLEVVQIYNLNGKLLRHHRDIKDKSFRFSDKSLRKQTLVLKIKTSEGKEYMVKILTY